MPPIPPMPMPPGMLQAMTMMGGPPPPGMHMGLEPPGMGQDPLKMAQRAAMVGICVYMCVCARSFIHSCACVNDMDKDAVLRFYLRMIFRDFRLFLALNHSRPLSEQFL